MVFGNNNSYLVTLKSHLSFYMLYFFSRCHQILLSGSIMFQVGQRELEIFLPRWGIFFLNLSFAPYMLCCQMNDVANDRLSEVNTLAPARTPPLI